MYKAGIFLFLFYIGTLILAEKITIAGTWQDSAVKYYREINHMTIISAGAPLPKNLTYIGKTILCAPGIWRSITNKISGNKIITIFTCQILETLRSIVTAITQKKLSNKFLVYEEEWNVVKMNHGKYELEILNIAFLIILPQC
ncbi:hypothetical protein GLOIN_2v1538775 [Rhizophagus irregularis DAOM 181602=DAOM 197198]|uniref:Uncharacterized protein n=1 Tax=Rhizophagus irregularis (strain DAOM 181602 / DAOM 197198 / MUCL 43194) TaxID=747089 RepID=A0A2P4QL56_RHIID|nr:hypothetical protein GLOIN_2v1538775 [Rhizophagus irregularis DAOM 181602=DAOM 197198]POG78373.1 hypothetical protein GLOIN_2v1538775 [Rhizophagus irregularis DAOM 181602=DAOM 197198]GET62719.1 hypothetical protein GLOIN_2v1538775 [Rhizophagus irregularis DAOM 181602=DAOM 197198]|eukprot:XP_025185239.1 hypothetical protein GLOIN_2v1538775 [Rhizophagus irregularis DAOM 181602=DAOM 197198]